MQVLASIEHTDVSPSAHGSYTIRSEVITEFELSIIEQSGD